MQPLDQLADAGDTAVGRDPQGEGVVAAEPGQLGGGLRFGSPAHGHAAIEDRVSLSYQKFVASGEYAFRPSGGGIRLGYVVKFAWATVLVAGDVVAGGGVEVLVLDDDGTIKRDNMFPG